MRLNFVVFIAVLSAWTRTSHAAHHGESPCDDRNGGCSHQCLYRGEGREYECGCPCLGRLGPEALTCIFAPECNVDLYFAIDIGNTTDPEGCATNNFSGWRRWRWYLRRLLEGFLAVESDPAFNIAVQFYSSPSPATTITGAEYTLRPDLQNAIDDLQARNQPNCAGSSSYATHIANSVTHPMAPRVLGDPCNTTRIAIGISAGPSSLTNGEIELERNRALLTFDELYVITQKQKDGDADRLNTAQARLFACGNASRPCPRIFWTDRNNEENIPFTTQAFLNCFYRNYCRLRPPKTDVVSVTSCDGNMTFDVDLCYLRGMKASDLQFLDTGCNVMDYATFSPDGRVMTVQLSLEECGITQKYVERNGEVKNQFKQILSTRDFSSNQTLIEVYFEAICWLDVFTEINVCIKPQQQQLTANATDDAQYALSVNAYTSENFTTVLLERRIAVGCPVFLGALTAFPSGLYLIFWSAYATPSTSKDDPLKHNLLMNGCPVDPTVQVLPENVPEEARLRFDMFEYTRTFNQPNDQKLNIYIHIEFIICEHHDADPRCNSNCARKKRSIADGKSKKTTIKKTIGPFLVEPKEAKPDKPLLVPEEASLDHKEKSSYEIEIVLPDLSAGTSTSLLQTATMAIVLLLFIYVVWAVNRRVRKKSEYFKSPIVLPYQEFSQSQRFGELSGNSGISRARSETNDLIWGESKDENVPPEYSA